MIPHSTMMLIVKLLIESHFTAKWEGSESLLSHHSRLCNPFPFTKYIQARRFLPIRNCVCFLSNARQDCPTTTCEFGNLGDLWIWEFNWNQDKRASQPTPLTDGIMRERKTVLGLSLMRVQTTEYFKKIILLHGGGEFHQPRKRLFEGLFTVWNAC